MQTVLLLQRENFVDSPWAKIWLQIDCMCQLRVFICGTDNLRTSFCGALCRFMVETREVMKLRSNGYSVWVCFYSSVQDVFASVCLDSAVFSPSDEIEEQLQCLRHPVNPWQVFRFLSNDWLFVVALVTCWSIIKMKENNLSGDDLWWNVESPAVISQSRKNSIPNKKAQIKYPHRYKAFSRLKACESFRNQTISGALPGILQWICGAHSEAFMCMKSAPSLPWMVFAFRFQ